MSIEIQGEEEGWQDDECSTILAQDRTGTKLCNACVKIFHPGRKRKHYVEDKPVFYRHLEYLDTLRRSASHGCELCNHVLRSLRACETEYAPAQELRIRYILTDHDASPDSCIPEILNINFTYRCHSKSADPMLHSIEAFLIAQDEKNLPSEIRSISTSPNIDLLKGWMSDCFANHAECTRFHDENYAPSRLLKMSADEDGVCRSVRLIETSDYVPNLSYMALSHRWGDCDFLNLTTENRSRLVSGFGIADLPKTFSDAICLTHRLGAEYLWIDSLCIIQDSECDWEREAFSMKKVYSNAMCTIAATRALDPHQGLHRPEGDAKATYYIPIETSWRLGYSRVGFLVGDIRGMDISDSPLLKRAWVIQEMALSPRKLHFAKSQIHWQCQERIACEALPLQYPKAMLSFDRHLYEWPENRGAQSSHWLSITWWKLVEAYSHGSLTKVTDKFAAFAGAAEQYQIMNGGLTYTCGMWKENMPFDLLWYNPVQARPGGKPSQRSQRYRAPSWSWLSLDEASILHRSIYSLEERCLVEVLDVAVVNAGDNAFGPIIAAALHIKGLLKSVRIVEFEHYKRVHELWIDDHSCIFSLDDANESTAGPVYCMPIYQETSTVAGLLLKPAVNGGPPDQLRRIACFEGFATEKSSRFFNYQDDDGTWKPLQPTTFTLV